MRLRFRFNHWWFRIFPGAGMVFYPYVLFKRGPEQTPAKLFRHELQHVYQVRQQGWLKFYLTWLWYTITRGYRGNPYEIEANAVENDPLNSSEQALWQAAVYQHTEE